MCSSLNQSLWLEECKVLAGPLLVMFSLPGVKILTRSTWTELEMDKGTLRCYSQKKWVMDAEKIQTTNMSPRGLLWDWVSKSKAKDSRSTELVSEAGLLHLKSLRKAGFSWRLWDSDRRWDLILSSILPSGSGWLQDQGREASHAGGTGCQTVS